jgi:hypothetical protein
MESPVSGPFTRKSYLMELPRELRLMILDWCVLRCMEDMSFSETVKVVYLACRALHDELLKVLLYRTPVMAQFYIGGYDSDAWTRHGPRDGKIWALLPNDLFAATVRELRVFLWCLKDRTSEGYMDYYHQRLGEGLKRLMSRTNVLKRLIIILDVEGAPYGLTEEEILDGIQNAIIYGTEEFEGDVSVLINRDVVMERSVEENVVNGWIWHSSRDWSDIDNLSFIVNSVNSWKSRWISLDGGLLSEFGILGEANLWRVPYVSRLYGKEISL